MIGRRSPAGVVLAGGASTRMGVDKAMLDVRGRPMVVGVADALRDGGCDPVTCQGGAEYLATVLGLDIVPDPDPGAGPVPAILASLNYHHRPIVVAACDLVDLDADTVRAVIAATAGDATAAVSAASAEGRLHLLSYWSEEALAPLQALVDEGVRAYRQVLERLGVIAVPVAPSAVRNVNRPEDLGCGR